MTTQQGTELYFSATHAAEKKKNPAFLYTFQKAKILYSQDEFPEIVATFEDGRKKVYGNPFENPFRKLQDAIEGVKTGIPPCCTVRTAIPHVEVIERLYKTTPIFDFSPESVYYDAEQDGFFVKGLFESLYNAYQHEELFSKSNPNLFVK